jgi:hypothetical protein
MKKILGISLCAFFSALPIMAGAANIDVVNGHGKIVDGDANKAVSVSYVKGAYNELGAVINKKQDQLKNGETDISSAVSSAVRDENGADNATLVTEKAVRDAIVSAIGSVTNDLQSGYATQSGVANTINNVTYTASLDNTAVTGTVTAMSEWGSSATSSVTMSGSVTNSAVTVSASSAVYSAN